MRLNYKFSNLLGCVYRKGNLDFSKDGSMKLYSPVGNRITVFDLKNNKSETLPCETNYNIECIAVSPNNTMMIVVDEIGIALFINLTSKVAIHSHDFRKKVNFVSFSPDGKRFAVAIDNSVVLYRTPGSTPEINPFVVDKRFKIMHDSVTCIDWSTDSRVMCVGSKDMNTYIVCAELCANLSIKPMGGLKDSVNGCFFLNNSLDFVTLSELGEVCVWESDTKLDGLIPGKRKEAKVYGDGDDRGDVSDEDEEEEKEDDDEEEEEVSKKAKKTKKDGEEQKKKVVTVKQVYYTRTAKHSFKKLLNETKLTKKKDDDEDAEANKNFSLIRLRASDFHKKRGLLVTAFENGVFYIHEMPNFELIQKLSLEDQAISSIRFDPLGDCVAVGCPKMGQLLVWEWMSEYCLLKQQGHFGLTNCFDYSPDGLHLASGGEDGKVKLWDLSTGNCFVTFSEHSSSVTGVMFKSNGQAFVTSSLDGTVRAFDMIRYRNFRTFTAPERTSTQFYSVALDYSGEIVCAGARDTFEIYIWSMKTGGLVNTLTGHEGPVCTLSFSIIDNILASGSWDHTVRLWSLDTKSGATDVIPLSSDVLSICFRPDGKHIAIATLDGQLTVYDVKTAIQLHSIEGQKDLGYSRKDTDKITAKKSSLGKSFKTISYTADGQYLLAGGQSKNICIYSIEDQILLRKFEITCNLSMDGTMEFLDRRRMTEFGSLSLADEDDFGSRNKLSLPGVMKGEFSGRAFKPEVRVNAVKFSPTGLSWIAATTEGILVYSLKTLVGDSFDPFELDLNVTPQRVDEMLQRSKFREALILALRLNSKIMIQKVLESVPTKRNVESMDVDDDDSEDEVQGHDTKQNASQFSNQMTYICSSLPDKYLHLLVRYLAIFLGSTRHVEFYATWSSTLLSCQAFRMKEFSNLAIKAALIALGRSLARIGRLVDVIEHNHYTLQFVLDQVNLKKIEDANQEPLIQ